MNDKDRALYLVDENIRLKNKLDMLEKKLEQCMDKIIEQHQEINRLKREVK